MTLKTLINFLCGKEEAIKQVAHCPQAIWVGFLFVLSAGFAREYDQEDLLHEPWYLFIPLVVSVVASVLLYLGIRIVFWLPSNDVHNSPLTYSRFLGLFWMTAPLAWLYAIPVERFMEADDAIKINLLLLAIVSVWRVFLISCVIAVLWRCSFFKTFMLVMLFSEGLICAILFLTPLPVLNNMGGIHLTEGEEIITSTVVLVTLFSVISFPIWLIGTVYSSFRYNRDRIQGKVESLILSPPIQISKSVWALSCSCVSIWFIILPLTQPEQIKRTQVESLFHKGEIDQAVTEMSKYSQSDFPPHWDPPPHPGYGDNSPRLSRILSSILKTKAAPWVLVAHLQKMKWYLSQRDYEIKTRRLFDSVDEDYLEELVNYIESAPQYRTERAFLFKSQIEMLNNTNAHSDHSSRKKALITRIEKLLPQ